MRQGIMILSLLIISACSTVANNGQSTFEGVWVWEDVDVTKPNPILKKHVLILQQGNYEESFFENTEPRGQQEGLLRVTRDGANVEFATVGNVQTLYKGYVSGDMLVINSINNKSLHTPALYRRN